MELKAHLLVLIECAKNCAHSVSGVVGGCRGVLVIIGNFRTGGWRGLAGVVGGSQKGHVSVRKISKICGHFKLFQAFFCVRFCRGLAGVVGGYRKLPIITEIITNNKKTSKNAKSSKHPNKEKMREITSIHIIKRQSLGFGGDTWAAAVPVGIRIPTGWWSQHA